MVAVRSPVDLAAAIGDRSSIFAQQALFKPRPLALLARPERRSFCLTRWLRSRPSASPDPQTGGGQGRLLLERGADVTLWCCGSSNTALLLAKTDAIKALLRAHGATE
jgi:hypothetical protein